MSSYNTPPPRPLPDPDTRAVVDIIRLVGTVLAVLVLAVLVAGVVLGVIGYDRIADRLDNIETSTQQTADYLDRTPAP